MSGRAAWALVVLAGLGGACGDGRVEAPTAPPGGVLVTIGDDVVRAEVARTPEQKTLGLGGRDGLAPGRGLVFPFDEPGYPAFWMQGMRFPIDIVWARGGQIVDISPDLAPPPPGPDPNAPPLPIYRPRAAADLVLEVPAGTAAASGWKRGDALRIEPPMGGGPGPTPPGPPGGRPAGAGP